MFAAIRIMVHNAEALACIDKLVGMHSVVGRRNLKKGWEHFTQWKMMHIRLIEETTIHFIRAKICRVVLCVAAKLDSSFIVMFYIAELNLVVQFRSNRWTAIIISSAASVCAQHFPFPSEFRTIIISDCLQYTFCVN